jgi:hypothetical protein
MITKEEIKKAMIAHGTWKSRLMKVIQGDVNEFDLGKVSRDDVCEFGRWLHNLPVSVKNEPIWKEVQTTHAKFHLEAARILGLATRGFREEALEALKVTNTFGQISGKMVMLLHKWRGPSA